MGEVEVQTNKTIDEQIEVLVQQADSIITDYWVWIDNANQSLKQARHQAAKNGDKDGVIKKRYSNIGPRIEKVTAGTSGEQYVRRKINWVVFPNDAIRRVPGKTKSGVKFAQFSKRVKPGSNGEYKLSTLARISSGWD